MGKFKPSSEPYIPQAGEFELREGRTLESTCYKPLGRVLLEISYDGSEYGGWQIQPNRLAVQEVLQEKLTKLYGGQFIHLIGASRTDAGVHAIGFAASFLTPVRPVIPLDKLLIALNNHLPPSIRIRSVREVPLDFHTRYDAIGKAYTYVINMGLETPFSARYSMLSTYNKLDAEKIEVHMMPISKKIMYTIDCYEFFIEDFGKIVFLTEAEAEEALTRIGGNDHEQNYQGNT